MIVNEEATWPEEVVRYLQKHYNLFLAWEQKGTGDFDFNAARAFAFRYDNAIYGLRAVLQSYTLHGYHCTRLTEPEIQHVVSHGMQLPNKAMLFARIEAIQKAGLTDDAVAKWLKQSNQADDDNRAGMIWFCFFPPHIAGEWGIERFFRSWGGEALYNSHERNRLTGPALRKIGVPCLVEADVSIAGFPSATPLEVHIYRQFLINRGLQTGEPVDHENRTTQEIPAENIRRIIRFPERDFIALTKCDTWTSPLV